MKFAKLTDMTFEEYRAYRERQENSSYKRGKSHSPRNFKKSSRLRRSTTTKMK